MGTANSVAKYLPLFVEGLVVPGFGRGGKQLGIPTANFSEELVEKIPLDIPCGVYYGFTNLNGGSVHPMAMSVGWNPHFKNQKKTIETHVIHNFAGEDFYGSWMRIVALGFIRPMRSYSSLPELIAAIQADTETAKTELAMPTFARWKSDSFFSTGEAREPYVVYKLLPSVSSVTDNNNIQRPSDENLVK